MCVCTRTCSHVMGMGGAADSSTSLRISGPWRTMCDLKDKTTPCPEMLDSELDSFSRRMGFGVVSLGVEVSVYCVWTKMEYVIRRVCMVCTPPFIHFHPGRHETTREIKEHSLGGHRMGTHQLLRLTRLKKSTITETCQSPWTHYMLVTLTTLPGHHRGRSCQIWARARGDCIISGLRFLKCSVGYLLISDFLGFFLNGIFCFPTKNW